jgi:hypothetical protein
LRIKRPNRAINLVIGLRVRRVFLRAAPVFEVALRILPGFFLQIALDRANSACSRSVGALRTLGFLIFDFLASATFYSLKQKSLLINVGVLCQYYPNTTDKAILFPHVYKYGSVSYS